MKCAKCQTKEVDMFKLCASCSGKWAQVRDTTYARWLAGYDVNYALGKKRKTRPGGPPNAG